MAYSYYRRRIETCRAQLDARGVDTGLVVSNAYAQAQRPVLVHAGPAPYHQLNGDLFEWPWIHLDSSIAERNTLLEEFTIWPTRERFTLDVTLFLIAAQLSNGTTPQDPAEQFSLLTSTDFSLRLYRFEDGLTSAQQVWASDPDDATNGRVTQSLKLYAAMFESATSPTLNEIAHSMNLSAFDPDAHLITPELRQTILYPQDARLIQPLRLVYTCDLEEDISTARDTPLIARVSWDGSASDIAWHESYNVGNKNNRAGFSLREAAYCRIYNIGSAAYMRGVV